MLALFLRGVPADAACTVSARTQSTVFAGSGTQTITGFTISASSPVFVVVENQSGTISSVNWNTSEALSLILNKADGIPVDIVAVYALKTPTTGTHNIDIVTASSGGGVAQVISTTGCDTTTGWRTVFSRNESDGVGPGMTVTDSQNGDLVLHAAEVLNNPITFDGGEDTTGTVTNNIAGNTVSGGVGTINATGANTAVGATDIANYSEIAFAVIASGGGAATPNRLTLLGVGGGQE